MFRPGTRETRGALTIIHPKNGRDRMSDDPRNGQGKAEPAPGLSADEADAVMASATGSAKVVHEVVRLQGEEELDRPVASLMVSGFAAGVSIGASVIAQAALQSRLPDAPWRELVVGLGYTVGFVVAIIGKLQLFTEATVTAVLPVATHPTWRNGARLLRLWAAVLSGNLAGTLLVAALIAHEAIASPAQLAAALDLSARTVGHGAWPTVLLGMPAGFLIASIAWLLPNARGSAVPIVGIVTYVIAIAGFSHVVAGSAEAWLMVLCGRMSLADAVLRYLLPVLAGNIVGGTGLFAVLAHGQVRPEIDAEG